MKDMFGKLLKTLESGKPAVMVTVVASSGSTPRGAGARMLITEEGRIAGTIGGGMVEYRSEQMAAEALKNKDSYLHPFYLRRNDVEDLGMICGGDVHVFFSYMDPASDADIELARNVLQMIEKDETSWLILDITEGSGGAMAVYGEASGRVFGEFPEELKERLAYKPVQAELEGRKYYCEKLVQAGKVYIIGGGHVAQALVPILTSVDFRCVIVEDREEFCRPELFKGMAGTVLTDMEKINEAVHITKNDYVCIMTRGHKNDETAESQALETEARYIGVIGSRKKIAGVNERLRKRGWKDEDIARITTPIGLAIKAETPAEIAISITGQLIEVRAAAVGAK